MNAKPQAPPPKVAPRLIAAPRIRQLYWCDFPQDAQLPEFWKRRPVVILSFKNTLHGAVTVVPCSTQAQPGNKWAFPLQTTIDGRAAWAICDKVTTVAVSRLVQDKGGIARMPQAEFDGMLRLVLAWLPVPSAPPPAVPAAPLPGPWEPPRESTIS
jgi:mRNA interferase MazF